LHFLRFLLRNWQDRDQDVRLVRAGMSNPRAHSAGLKEPTMRGSLRLGTIAGIGVYLHWTFVILVAWIFGAHLLSGRGWLAGVAGVAFICALFGCIVLHELGHALTARRFGVATRDITLLPIGGVARLQRMPEHPLQEFLVAVGGPVVTAVIACVLAAVLWLSGGTLRPDAAEMAPDRFVQNLMWANVILLVFNLIPAFPMDGGRMLRSLLALKLDYVRATNIAARLGQVMAIGFAIFALLSGNLFLLFIALFVFLGASGESHMAQVRMLLKDVPVRDAMITHFRALAPSDPVRKAAEELLAGWQTDFPVIEEGRFRGMLRRSDIESALQEHGGDVEVRQVMHHECPTVTDRDMLYRAMEQMQSDHCGALPVMHDGEMVGLVTTENIGEVMMIRSAASGRTVLDGTPR
jgi:Zn-dependent protease/predicted transcriptional regulator